MFTVIFDLNRTLYDPDTKSLLPNVHSVLQTLRGHNAEMHVISRKEPGRENILKVYGIESFFSTVTFVEDKTREFFEEKVRLSQGSVYIIGDYLHEEIRFGNQAGGKTMWLKRGKFSNLLPESDDDIPWRTISELSNVANIILDDQA